MGNCSVRSQRAAILLVILFILTLSVMARADVLFPWEGPNSVRAALSSQVGSEVSCEAATVWRIAARNDPPFFVIQDPLNSNSRIVVLARANAGLRRGHTVDVRGTLQRLSNGELCISGALVEGYVDNEGVLTWIPPLPVTLLQANKVALAAAVSVVPPSDPSLPTPGIAGAVTAADTDGASDFDTAASLLTAAPPVLTSVRLSCNTVREAGEGYIVIGDDHNDNTVKIYTNTQAKPGDRIVRATGEVHSENGSLILYTDSGPAPYFDAQAARGSVVVAKPGTIAYAATLPDANDQSGRLGLMSVYPHDKQNEAWVYLTGQVVTYIGQYYSYDISPPGWVDVYNVQGVDRKPGIRVWKPAGGPDFVGSIVDIMAKLDTKDGQRLLGKWSADKWNAVNLSLSSHSMEAVVLASRNYLDPELPNLRPLGMNNSQLGGPTWGNNPGVTEEPGYHGFYNIADRVCLWGRVIESGPRWDEYYYQLAWPYQFDEWAYETIPYIRIDDGAGVLSGNSYDASYGDPYGTKGVIVFGANTYDGSTQVEVCDYVLVRGVSSVWKPYNVSYRYRCVWVNSLEYPIYSVDGPVREITSTGTVSGTVKLYDMPEEDAVVKVCCSNGRMQDLTVTRQADGSGSANYEFTGVPKTVYVTDPYFGSYAEEPRYLVSAQSEGYKTRTYTPVTPWTGTATPRNLYLTRLRKIYVTTNDTSLNSCSTPWDSTTITATVRDADHNPIQGVTVRFRTNKGSFSSGSIVHDTLGGATNSTGQAAVTLYGPPSEWTTEGAIVEATDDSAPLAGDDPDDDPYKYDWIQLHNNYGQPTEITISQPSTNLALTANPTAISRCGNEMSTVTATVTACGSGFAGAEVSFSTTKGVFNETGNTTATATTNGSGTATVHLKAADQTPQSEGTATVSATATVYGIILSDNAQVIITHDKLTFTANRWSVTPSQGSATLTARLTTPSGASIANQEIMFTTTAGNLSVYSGTTNSSGQVTTTLTNVSQGSFAVVEATATNRCNGDVKQRCQVDFLQTAADDWPMFMHDARHQGYSRYYDNITTENLTLVWSKAVNTASGIRTDWNEHPTGGKANYIFPHPYIDSSPVQASGSPVIVGAWASGLYEDSSTMGYVKAFDATSGADAWRYPTSGYIGAVASTPCIADVGEVKRVYFGSMDGKVYCLNAGTGAALWSLPYQTLDSIGGNGKILAVPVVYNGRVYIGNESATVYCLNATTGALVWSQTFARDVSWPDRTGVSSVAIGPTATGEMRAYVGCDNGHVYCLSLADSLPQRVLWDYAGEDGLGLGCIESSPTVYAGNMYVGASWYLGTDLLALNAEDGTLVWHRELREEFRATAAALENHIFVGEDTGTRFHRLNAGTGATEPNLDPPNPFHAENNRPSPAGTNDYFVGSAAYTSAGFGLVGNDNFALYTLSSTNNSMIRMRGTGGIVCSSPAISYAAQSSYRWVYLVSRVNGGTLYAYRQLLN